MKKPAPLPRGIYATDTRHWSSQMVSGMAFVAAEKPGTRTLDKLEQLPGVKPYVELYRVDGESEIASGPVRGLHVVDGKLLAVAGTDLYQVTPTLVAIYRGNIPGTGAVSIAHNASGLANEVLVANGSAGYVYHTSDLTLDKVTDEGYPGASVVAFIDQYLIQVEPQGRYLFWSDLSDAASYNTIDRAEAEADPDRIVTLHVSNREVIVFGRQTTEIFINTGSATGTFQRAPNTVIEHGCCARRAVVSLDGAVLFLDDKRVPRLLVGYDARPLKNIAVEQAFAECSEAEIASAFAFTWEGPGHKVAYFTVPGRFTFGYDLATDEWHRRQSPGMEHWRINSLVYWNGQWVGGDIHAGKLYTIDKDYFYDGRDELIREFETGVAHADQRRMQFNDIEVLAAAGGPACDLADFPAQPGPPVIAGPSTVSIFTGVAFSELWTATEGTLPYTFTVPSGYALPPDAELASDGSLTGTAGALGSYPSRIRVTASDGLWDEMDVVFTITEIVGPLLVTDEYDYDGASAADLTQGADIGFTVPADNVRVSPDGLYAAASNINTDTGTFFQIRKFNHLDGTWSALTDPADMPPEGPAAMAWSPDGVYLAITTDEVGDYVWVYKRTGDTFTKLAEPSEVPAHAPVIFGLAWNEDGTRLAVHAAFSSQSIYVYDFEDEELVNMRGLSGTGTSSFGQPARIAFRGNLLAGMGEAAACVVDTDPDPMPVVDYVAISGAGAGEATGCFWTDDEHFVGVYNQKVYVFNFDGVNLTELSADSLIPTADRDSDIDPTGRYLAVAHASISIIDLGAGVPDPVFVETIGVGSNTDSVSFRRDA